MAEGRSGDRVKAFEGTGDRKYFIGLSVKGDRILVLVDVSASMMDETVVNVIRLRNMPESRRRSAEKWRRTIATVDWITAQLPTEVEVPDVRLQHAGEAAGAGQRRQVARCQ